MLYFPCISCLGCHDYYTLKIDAWHIVDWDIDEIKNTCYWLIVVVCFELIPPSHPASSTSLCIDLFDPRAPSVNQAPLHHHDRERQSDHNSLS